MIRHGGAGPAPCRICPGAGLGYPCSAPAHLARAARRLLACMRRAAR